MPFTKEEIYLEGRKGELTVWDSSFDAFGSQIIRYDLNRKESYLIKPRKIYDSPDVDFAFNKDLDTFNREAEVYKIIEEGLVDGIATRIRLVSNKKEIGRILEEVIKKIEIVDTE